MAIKRDAADKWFSECVRLQANNTCQHTSKTNVTLDCCHIIGRRSSRQSRALHLLFERIADCLFAYGLNLSVNCSVFKQPLERAWKAEDVKKLIWHPVMQALTDKTSTTQLTGQEIDDIYAAIQERFFLKDITLPEFPREDITYGNQEGRG